MATIREALQFALQKYQADDFATAERICREVLGHEPGNVDALHLLGLLARKQQQFQQALDCFQQAVALRPEKPLYHFELGIALHQLGRLDEAFAAQQRAIELKPDFQEAFVNAGVTRDELGLHEEALAWYLRARELKPDCVSTHINLGNVYMTLGRFDESIHSYRRATALDPDCAKAHWNCAMACLRVGKFREGWEEYEWREAAGETKLDAYPQPRWDGSPLKGKTLLVASEQGVGDEILFASCYPDVIARADHCIFVCEPRLAGLFARSFPDAAVIGFRRRSDRAPPELPRPADCYLHAGSLPRFFRPDLASFPARDSYLRADPHRTALWRERFAALGPGKKIGISWRAGGKPAEQAKRATHLRLWRSVFAVPGTHFINLQYGQCDEDLAAARDELGVEIHDWPDADALTDLDGLAAQIAALDLVIAVGNTTVHLAGSLGVAAWALVPEQPSWRWMVDVDRVPWYTSVRLFRQGRGEGWQAVLERVSQELCRELGVSPVSSARAAATSDGALSGRYDPGPGERFKESAPVRIPAQVSGLKFVASLTEKINDAVKRHQAGDLASAERVYREVLQHTPQHADALHLLGVICQQTGRTEQAIKLIRQAIALVDVVPNFYYHLALALKDAGRHDEAIAAYRRAVELKPDFAEAQLNLGAILHEQHHYTEALPHYEQALQLRPGAAAIHFNLGSTLRRLGRAREALDHFQKAVEQGPELAEARLQMGRLLQDEGRLGEAVESYRQAIAARPGDAAAYNCLARAYQQQQRIDEAILCYQQALELKPDCFEALANLGSAFHEQEQFALALDCYRRALASQPADVSTRLNIATVLRHEGKLDEALACAEEVLALEPDNPQAHLHRALVWLQLGDFQRGWPEYEWRWKATPGLRSREFATPAWNGEPLEGRRVLVHGEQRLADEILFASCLPDLIRQAGRTVVACDPRLASLVARSFPAAEVVPVDHRRADAWPLELEALHGCDVQVAAGSVPGYVRPTLASFPAQPAFLVPDRARVAGWHERLRALGRGPKIGIAWQSGKKRAATSGIPGWEHWRAPLQVAGCHFIALESGPHDALAAAELDWQVQVQVLDESNPLENIDDLAARIAALDLVISVDNVAAHLAGALGTPVWLLLPYAWGWQWMLQRDDTPWYPSMRLWRPARPGLWGEMFQRLAGELREVVARLSPPPAVAPRRLGPPHWLDGFSTGQRPSWPSEL